MKRRWCHGSAVGDIVARCQWAPQEPALSMESLASLARLASLPDAMAGLAACRGWGMRLASCHGTGTGLASCRGTLVGIALEHWCHLAPASPATALPGAGSSWGHWIMSPLLSPTCPGGGGGCRFGCLWLQLAAEGSDAPGLVLDVGLSPCWQGGLG